MFSPISNQQSNYTGATTFRSLQEHSDKPILVKFVAPHCSGCKTIQPILEQLARDHADNIYLIEIDITEDPETAMELDVRSVPTVALFKKDQEIGRLVGVQAKNHYIALVKQALH